MTESSRASARREQGSYESIKGDRGMVAGLTGHHSSRLGQHPDGTGVPEGIAPGTIFHCASVAEAMVTDEHTPPSDKAFCGRTAPVEALTRGWAPGVRVRPVRVN